MNDPVSEWLADRLRDAPDELRARMLAALGEVPGGLPEEARTVRSLVGPLRAAADRLLGQAVRGPASPETGVVLLASDGLATLACEALAESAPDVMREVP